MIMKNDILDRMPPQELEAEQCLLGSVILDPQMVDEVSLEVSEADFYDDANRKIWSVIEAMYVKKHGKVDPNLLASELKRRGILEAVGGLSYLARIVQAVPNASHAISYAKNIRRASTRREVLSVANECLRDAYDEQRDIAAVLADSQDRLCTVAERSIANAAISAKELSNMALDELEKRQDRKGSSGVKTGFSELDSLLGGMTAGQVVTVGGRPSMGKSALVSQIAVNAANSGTSTLMVSLEMSQIELADRMLSGLAEVNSYRMRNGSLSPDERRSIIEASSIFSQLPFHLVDDPGLSLSQIGAHCRRMKRRIGLGLLVVDYLQLVEPDNHRDPREQQVSKVCRGLKRLAKSLGIPVIVAAQLNRKTEDGDKRPRLSHLRESGSIEQDSDIVLFVHR